MFRLDAVLIRANYFEHNAHKAAIILVICMLLIYLFLLLMLYFLFYSCFDGLGEIWELYSFWLLYRYCLCKITKL